MEAIAKDAKRNGPLIAVVIILSIIGLAYATVINLSPEGQDELLEFFQEFLPFVMFGMLAFLLFTGFPVAFILGGLALASPEDICGKPLTNL